ncbi:MAG: hypothetical protein RLZZ324_498, partial [Candidatus Parcubacteria bacterium]
AKDRLATRTALKAWLEHGMHVFANRYVPANQGHQGSKIADPAERATFWAWEDALEYGTNGLPRPAVTVILHVPVDISLQLIERRGLMKDGHETRAHLELAEKAYLELAQTSPEFTVVECAPGGNRLEDLLSMDAIHELVWVKVKPLLGDAPSAKQ